MPTSKHLAEYTKNLASSSSSNDINVNSADFLSSLFEDLKQIFLEQFLKFDKEKTMIFNTSSSPFQSTTDMNDYDSFNSNQKSSTLRLYKQIQQFQHQQPPQATRHHHHHHHQSHKQHKQQKQTHLNSNSGAGMSHHHHQQQQQQAKSSLPKVTASEFDMASTNEFDDSSTYLFDSPTSSFESASNRSNLNECNNNNKHLTTNEKEALFKLAKRKCHREASSGGGGRHPKPTNPESMSDEALPPRSKKVKCSLESDQQSDNKQITTSSDNSSNKSSTRSELDSSMQSNEMKQQSSDMYFSDKPTSSESKFKHAHNNSSSENSFDDKLCSKLMQNFMDIVKKKSKVEEDDDDDDADADEDEEDDEAADRNDSRLSMDSKLTPFDSHYGSYERRQSMDMLMDSKMTPLASEKTLDAPNNFSESSPNVSFDLSSDSSKSETASPRPNQASVATTYHNNNNSSSQNQHDNSETNPYDDTTIAETTTTNADNNNKIEDEYIKHLNLNIYNDCLDFLSKHK
jgi:hypothetical protein